jgi:hypothetical protein
MLKQVLWIRNRTDLHLFWSAGSGSSRAKSTKISQFLFVQIEKLAIKQGYLTILAFSVEIASCLIPLKVKQVKKLRKIFEESFKIFFPRFRMSKNPGSGSALGHPDPH